MDTRAWPMVAVGMLTLVACGDDGGGGDDDDEQLVNMDYVPADTGVDDGRGGDDGGPGCPDTVDTPQAIIEAYGRSWGETNFEVRDCLIERSLTMDVVYQDPGVLTEGAAALIDHIAVGQGQGNGVEIRIEGEPDVRDGEARFAWAYSAGGTQLSTGEDYVEFGDDGRMFAITGFFKPFRNDNIDGAIADLMQAWNSTDDSERDALLVGAFASNARYTDGAADVTGPDGVAGIVAGELTVDSLYSYGDPARARAVLDIDGATSIAYIAMDADGMIIRMAVFAGEL